MKSNPVEQQATLRRATERLLAWGFSPRSIAQQLRCSPSWVYAVRRERSLVGADVEELHTTTEVLLHRLDF